MTMRGILCAALLAATPFATAQTVEPAPPVAPASSVVSATTEEIPAADPDEKVCKVARELGSNKLKRVCRTRAQIDAEREGARDALSREQRR